MSLSCCLNYIRNADMFCDPPVGFLICSFTALKVIQQPQSVAWSAPCFDDQTCVKTRGSTSKCVWNKGCRKGASPSPLSTLLLMFLQHSSIHALDYSWCRQSCRSPSYWQLSVNSRVLMLVLFQMLPRYTCLGFDWPGLDQRTQRAGFATCMQCVYSIVFWFSYS